MPCVLWTVWWIILLVLELLLRQWLGIWSMQVRFLIEISSVCSSDLQHEDSCLFLALAFSLYLTMITFTHMTNISQNYVHIYIYNCMQEKVLFWQNQNWVELELELIIFTEDGTSSKLLNLSNFCCSRNNALCTKRTHICNWEGINLWMQFLFDGGLLKDSTKLYLEASQH